MPNTLAHARVSEEGFALRSDHRTKARQSTHPIMSQRLSPICGTYRILQRLALTFALQGKAVALHAHRSVEASSQISVDKTWYTDDRT